MHLSTLRLFALLLGQGCTQGHPTGASHGVAREEATLPLPASLDFSPDAAGFVGHHPNTRLEVAIDPQGVELRGDQGRFHLRFAAWGAPGALQPLEDAEEVLSTCERAEPDACADAVDLVHETVTERWVNGEDGLEQRWEIAAPPEPSASLVLEVAVSGAELALSDDGASVWILADEGGLFRYTGLEVWDATGEALPAHLEVSEAAIHVVVDTPADVSWPLFVDPIVTPADWTGTGTAASAAYGASVAAAGDVNGDLYADIVIGAPAVSCTAPVAGAGKVYVIYGSGSGLGAGTASTTLSAPSSAACYGGTVAGVGDVNHDGYDDIAVGAPGTTSYTGTAYIYHGSASGLGTSVASTLTGPATSSCFGTAIAGGDITRDGYSDVAVSAGCYNSSQGRVQVYKGSSSGVATSATSTLTGSAGSWFGYSIDVGDVNKDRYADLVVGACHASSNRGAVYYYKGTSTGLSSSPTSTLSYPSGTYFFGSGVAILENATGTGHGDVVATAYTSAGSSPYGRVYLFKGSTSGLASSPASYVTDSTYGSRFGQPLAAAGDLNDDGYVDLVVGAPYADGKDGRVYVYEGGSAGFTLVETLTSDYPDAQLGFAVAGVGDTDGLYNADILIGAPYADVAVGGSSYTDNGVVQLYLGCTSGDGDC